MEKKDAFQQFGITHINELSTVKIRMQFFAFNVAICQALPSMRHLQYLGFVTEKTLTRNA